MSQSGVRSAVVRTYRSLYSSMPILAGALGPRHARRARPAPEGPGGCGTMASGHPDVGPKLRRVLMACEKACRSVLITVGLLLVLTVLGSAQSGKRGQQDP